MVAEPGKSPGDEAQEVWTPENEREYNLENEKCGKVYILKGKV